MDLFEKSAQKRRIGQPLAERMRPTDFSEVVGQSHIVGKGQFLDKLGAANTMPSLILYGPPGTGKTTIARLLAERARATLISLSAVSCGVKDIRAVVADARQRLVERGGRTLLFLDEIHRFSKSQQDALLPHVEAGTVILIGATTENPSFEVNAALLSRTRVVRLETLAESALDALIDRALTDGERGLAAAGCSLTDGARRALIGGCDGDARRILNALEVATELTHDKLIDEPVVEQALGRRTIRYDKAGEEHYGVVSAFIKSMRGSDPSAAVYWMTRMLEAGEDPMFIVRRIVIFASEDIGNADPAALSIATAAAAAVRLIGLPEGALALTQAVLYCASAAKSNSALTTYANARKAVLKHGSLPVPNKLRNASSAVGKALGHGRGYRYPHHFSDHYVAERYLPDALSGAEFYQPSSSGAEAGVQAALDSRREQLAECEPLTEHVTHTKTHTKRSPKK